MSFHEVRFPVALSQGSSGGPERYTEVVMLASGHEERNTPWQDSRRRYDAGLGIRSLDDIEILIAFFEARSGRLHGFRWRDWLDWRSCPATAEISYLDQVIATGDGAETEFDLRKRYASGAQAYDRPITKPVAGTVRVGVNGQELSEGADWSVNHATGALVFTVAPAAGAAITAGFAFDVPARFDTDRLEISYAGFAAGDVPSVPVVEIRV